MTRRERWMWPALLGLLTAAALWFGWIGFIASDDALYHAGAMRWLEVGPSPGADHWSTRFPLILSFAAILRLAGDGFAAFATTALLWYFALIVVAGGLAARIGGVCAGWIAAILIATMPVIVSHASTVSCDLAEAFFLLAGVWLLAGSTGGLARGVAAGMGFGLAILCRETAGLALAGLGPLFLIGRPIDRRLLIAAGVGLGLVIGGEMLFQYALIGDPLHRYALAFHHDAHIDRAANMEGNFLLHPVIDPVLVLLVNDDFGLLFWLVPVALMAGAVRGLPPASRRLMLVLSAMATANFLLVAVMYGKLVLNPRYFTLPAITAAIMLALWLARSRPALRLVAIGGLVGTNLLLAGLGNAHPRWGMEAMVRAAAAHPDEPVYAPADDVARAWLPLRFAGLTNARPAPAPPGAWLVTATPPADAPVAMRYPSPPTRVGAIVETLGLAPLVPGGIARRLFHPSPEQYLLRAPGAVTPPSRPAPPRSPA